MKKLALLIIFAGVVEVCFCQQPEDSGDRRKPAMKKINDKRTSNGHLLMTAEVIENPRTDKGGEIISGSDLYVRRSAQDYFIKFSESAVTEQEVRKAMAKIKHPIKSLTIEAEIRNGIWDSCDGNETVHGRTGMYIVIHKLIVK